MKLKNLKPITLKEAVAKNNELNISILLNDGESKDIAALEEGLYEDGKGDLYYIESIKE